MQSTLKSAVSVNGIGLHTGTPVCMTIRPARAGLGVWFRRVDVDGDQWIPARWDAVVPSMLCTRIANDAGAEVSTIEHVMAAIAGTGLSNAVIEIDGPEVPIGDGSAAEFVGGILSRGLIAQNEPVYAIEIRETVEISTALATARLEPAAGMLMSFRIAFPDPAIGRQERTLDLANGAFVRDLCDSRTFCRLTDVERMRADGLILGGTLENAVVVDGDRIVTPGGLRHGDEAVRHKMLDAVGDLALAGGPILGHYHGDRAGHAMTNALLRRLFANPEAYRLVPCDGALAARLPGGGLTRGDLVALAA
jgi:UDP-3-O-[3-hydroxymyristoyl] N-acetylglucosamine deacetylase